VKKITLSGFVVASLIVLSAGAMKMSDFSECVELEQLKEFAELKRLRTNLVIVRKLKLIKLFNMYKLLDELDKNVDRLQKEALQLVDAELAKLGEQGVSCDSPDVKKWLSMVGDLYGNVVKCETEYLVGFNCRKKTVNGGF